MTGQNTARRESQTEYREKEGRIGMDASKLPAQQDVLEKR